MDYETLLWSLELKHFCLIIPVECCLDLLYVHSRLNTNLSNIDNMTKAQLLINIQVIRHLHGLKYIEVLGKFDLAGGNLAKFRVADCYFYCVVNVRPLRSLSNLHAVVTIPHQEVRRQLEVGELKLLRDVFTLL